MGGCPIRSLFKNYHLQIVLFGFVAYLLPLACVLLMKNTAWGQINFLYFALLGIAAASPTIAAVISVTFFEKKAGLKRFFCLIFSPKLRISEAVAPVMIACAIMCTAKVASCLLLAVPFEMGKITSVQLIVILWAFFAEEIGWRGFLTQKLTALVNPPLVPLLVGLIWAFWHYHFFILGSIQVAIPLFLAGCVVDSYLYFGLLKMLRGNILVAMFYHMASNFFIHLFLINPDVNKESLVPYAAYVVISAVVAIGIAANNHLSHSPK